MAVTTTELKQDLKKYLDIAQTQDVLITRNGKVIARLVPPYKDKLAIAKSLIGILDSDITAEEARDERLATI